MKPIHSSKGSISSTEFTDYQKVIEQTENVILCVAKAETMVRNIGTSLLESESESPEQSSGPFDIESAADE
jgi:hypothetical protein